MTEVIWTEPALIELRAAVAYIAKDSPSAAQRVRDKIQSTADDLTLFPNRGRPGAVENTRELVVAHTFYVIAYRIIGEVVWVVYLFHSAQDYPADALH